MSIIYCEDKEIDEETEYVAICCGWLGRLGYLGEPTAYGGQHNRPRRCWGAIEVDQRWCPRKDASVF